jgi:SWIM zinc finger
MSTVAPAPSARTVRHGRTDLQLRIGGTWYKLRTMPPPEGFRVVRTLKKLDPHGPPATYTVAQAKGEDARCTCPDHDNGHVCKHIMALVAHGLMALPKAARPKPAPSEAQAKAKALRAHAKTARAHVAAANALPADVRRHLAALGPEPTPIRGTDRRAALAELPPVANLDIHAELGIPAQPARPALPEGWQLGGEGRRAAATAPPAPKVLPPAPEGSFTAGFRQAVQTHLAVKRGDLIECAACSYPFDAAAEGSAPLSLCGPCLLEEKGGRS